VFSVSIPDIIMETGLHQNYAGSVSGGNDLITYYVGGRYTWEDGIMGAEEWGPIRDIESSKQASMNLSLLPSENLRLQVSTRYTDRHHTPTEDGTPNSAISITMLAKPEFADANNPGGWRAFATLPEAMQIVQSEDTKRFGGALTANYSFTPALSIEATAGVDIVSQIASQFRPFGWNVSGVSQDTPDGYREVWDRSHDEFTLEGRASWNTNLTEQLTSGLVVGAQTLIANSHTTLSVGEQFPGPGLEVTGAGAIQSNTETILKTVSAGVYAQEQVGFRNYLFFTVGARYDKHSAFGEEAGGAVYPKASFSLVPSDMPGWDGLGPVSTLRLRAAVGQSGLQPGAFDALTTFSPLASEEGPGVEPDNLGNPELRPEVATEWEAGFEAGFFENRFALDVTYWNRTVSDLLVARQFAPTGGFLSTQLDNVGQMDAWGVELGLNGQVYSSEGISVNAFVNGAYIRETVTDMGGAPPIDFGTRNRSWIREGYSPGAFFGGKLVDAEYPFDTNGDGNPDSQSELMTYFGDPRSPDEIEATMMAVDEDGDGDLLDHFLGKPTPDWTGAFGADMSIGSNLTLSTLFEYRAGNFQITNHTEGFRYSSVNLGRNTPEAAQIEATLLNPASSAEDRLAAAKRYTETGAALAKFNGLNQVQDANFIRWREMSVTYRLPASLIGNLGADDIAVTASGRNLMLWTEYLGIDPETKNSPDSNIDLGHDAHKLGLPRRFSFSVRVSF
jgi:outer membrane receptor protein involved in Fe transport